MRTAESGRLGDIGDSPVDSMGSTVGEQDPSSLGPIPDCFGLQYPSSQYAVAVSRSERYRMQASLRPRACPGGRVRLGFGA